MGIPIDPVPSDDPVENNGLPDRLRFVADPRQRATCNTATQKHEKGTAAFAAPSELRHAVFVFALLVPCVAIYSP